MTDAPSHRARKRRVIGEKAEYDGWARGSARQTREWSSGSTPGGTPALLGRFYDPGQVTPRSALLSGLLGDVNEKVPSARGQSRHGASAPNVTMTMTTTACNQLDLGLTSISDTKRKVSQSKGFLISYISSCLSFMSKGLVITFILCVLRRCGL